MNSLQGFIWTNVEVSMGIVCACLPVMRPLFRRLLKDPLSSFKRSHESSNQSSSLRRPSGVNTPSADGGGGGNPSLTRLHHPLDNVEDDTLPLPPSTRGSTMPTIETFQITPDVEWGIAK